MHFKKRIAEDVCLSLLEFIYPSQLHKSHQLDKSISVLMVVGGIFL